MTAVYIAVAVTVLMLGFGQWMLHRKGGSIQDLPPQEHRSKDQDRRFPNIAP